MTPRNKRRRKHKKCSSSTSENDSKDSEPPERSPPKQIKKGHRGLTSEGSSGKLKDIIQELLKNDCPSKGTDENTSRVLKSYVETDRFKENKMMEKAIQPIEMGDIDNIHFRVTAIDTTRTEEATEKKHVIENDIKSKPAIGSTPLFTGEEITKRDKRNDGIATSDAFLAPSKCRYEMEEEEPKVFLSLKNDRRTKKRQSKQLLRTNSGSLMTRINLIKTGSVSSCSIDSAFEQARLPPPPPPPRNETEWIMTKVQADDFIDRMSESISKWFGLCATGKQ
jgi:hypothetical protein